MHAKTAWQSDVGMNVDQNLRLNNKILFSVLNLARWVSFSIFKKYLNIQNY